MPSYKLYYFNSRGLGEVIRLAFAVAGVDYEDIRYTDEEWSTHMADMPLQKMPVLEIDGKKYCQSAAIARMIAREYGLYGVDITEAFRIDELYEAVSDLITQMFKPYYETDEEKKLSVADLALFNVMDLAEKWHGSPLLVNNPKLEALINRVKDVPEIKAWLEKRPVTVH